MSVRILNHALEIISLLTGEASLLQHLTNLRIQVELKKDKRMSDRILTHAIDIIYLLTGEEYTIVKKNSCHSIDDRLTRDSTKQKDGAVSLSMEVWEQTEGYKEPLSTAGITSHISPALDESVDTVSEEEEDEKDIQQVTIHSDLCAGDSDDDLNAVSINEDGEYEREEKEILKVTIHSDTCAGIYAGNSNVKPPDVPRLELKEVADAKGGLPPVKEEEIPISISEDGSVRSNDGREHGNHLAKESKSHAESSTPKSHCGTQKNNKNRKSPTIYMRRFNKASLNRLETSSNVTAKNNHECGENSHSHFVTPRKNHLKKKSWTCSKCGDCFSEKTDLVTHKRSHTAEKPFECSECGKCFRWKSDLASHQIIHTGEKPIVCSECGKCFRWKTELVCHQRIHTGEKPFACSDCGKCFRNKSQLVSHQKVHTGEKPFVCSECRKCFSRSTHLAIHMKIHTGEKPFVCSECGKCFRVKAALIRHSKTHIG